MLYPLKFKKIFKEKIWGGRKLETVMEMELPKDVQVGESWEVSCYKNEVSLIDNGEFKGQSLGQMINLFAEELLGQEVYEKYGNKFPLLIKYLDINDKLSIQVHPNDEYAWEFENSFGKSEAWYVIDASEDAKIIIGLAKDTDRKKLIKSIENKEFKDIFNIVRVKKGDLIHIAPGLVHATLEGNVLICEIQQNSDSTYRLYDFDRIVNGEKRELHLEKALDVIDYDKIPEITSHFNETDKNMNENVLKNILKSEYFNIDMLTMNGEFKAEIYKNFRIFSVLEGFGKIVFENENYDLKIGDTYFIPANLEFDLNGKLEILVSYI